MNVIVIQCLFFVERRQNHRSRDIKEEKKGYWNKCRWKNCLDYITSIINEINANPHDFMLVN